MQRYSPVTKVADTTAVLEAETLGYTLGDVEAKVHFCTLADTLRQLDDNTHVVEPAVVGIN